MANEHTEFAASLGTAVKPGKPSGRPDSSMDFDEFDEDEVAPTGVAKRWAANGDTMWGAAETYESLPPAAYYGSISDNVGPVLRRVEVKTDDLLALPDSAGDAIVHEFKKFWTLKEAFAERGFLHKRGFLLWGPPASGKTTTIALMSREMIENHDGIIFMIDHPHVARECLRMIRRIEPDRPVVAIMEDIDALLERYGEAEFLSILDGESQVANIVFVATTNYPERLDKRIVDRPSRFDTIKKIGFPKADARRLYFKTKAPDLSEEELEHFVVVSKGFSIAHLKELIIATKCIGQDLDAVIDRMNKMRSDKPTSDNDEEDTGFGKVLGFGRS